jgi:hypothetical protein
MVYSLGIVQDHYIPMVYPLGIVSQQIFSKIPMVYPLGQVSLYPYGLDSKELG